MHTFLELIFYTLYFLIYWTLVSEILLTIDSIIFFFSPTFSRTVSFSPVLYSEVTRKWLDRMENAEARERKFQLEREQAYTAAYQQTENVSYYYILPEVYRFGKNRKFC